MKGSWKVKVLIESDLDVLKDGLVMVGNVINSSKMIKVESIDIVKIW